MVGRKEELQMNVKKVFCEECRNDVDYVVATTLMTGSIREKEYSTH